MASYAKQIQIGYPSTLVFDCEPHTHIKGYLQDYPKTVYFSRRIRKKGLCKFPIVASPEKIVVRSSKPIQLLSQEPLEIVSVYLPLALQQVLPFFKEFANEASYLVAGHAYESDDQNNVILFVNQIYNVRKGKKIPSPTPARISRETGRITINAKMFQKMTVPQRMFILLHEYMHYLLNSSSEFEVDLQALRAYLSLGFSRIESVYALTKILHDSDFSAKRVRLLIDYIKKFEK